MASVSEQIASRINLGSIAKAEDLKKRIVFTLLGLLLGVENFDVYKLLVYFVTLFGFALIVYNSKFLKNYSTLYLFGGWVITCSWFMGYVDVLSVLFCTLICKTMFSPNPNYFKTFIWMLLMTINHNAVSFGIFIIIFILIIGQEM